MKTFTPLEYRLLQFVAEVAKDCDNDAVRCGGADSGPYCTTHGISTHSEEARDLLEIYGEEERDE